MNIHQFSDCSGQPLISINCLSFQNELLERKMFGYEKGAFTGAVFIEIRQVSDLCQRYGTILVVDEVHAEHILDGKFVSCLTSGCAAQDNLLVLTSPNKALKLGGLKTSYSMIPDDSLRQRFRQQLEKLSLIHI